MLTGDENIVDLNFTIFGSLMMQKIFFLMYETLKLQLKVLVRV